MTEQVEKKSERFEVRLPYTKKKDFIQACDEQGDTPSHAVRRFINSYIRRANTDNLKASVRGMTRKVKRKWVRVSLKSLAVIVGLFVFLQLLSLMLIPFENMKTQKLFAIYDSNINGVIDLGEISDNDEDLHRVLNIDGELGISNAEFTVKGKMIWSFVNPKTFKVIKEQRGFLKQSSTTTQTSTGLDKVKTYYKTIVTFDLTDPDAIELTSWQLKNQAQVSSLRFFQRKVDWVKGQSAPVFVIGKDYKLAQLNPIITDE